MELQTGQASLSRDAIDGTSQYIEHDSLVEYVDEHLDAC